MSRFDRWVLAACVVAGLVARTVLLGRDDFWSDEVHTFQSAHGPAAALVGERLGAGHVPLYFLIVQAWTSVAGESQFALRFPSALFGTALLVPAFALFRRLLPAVPARWAVAILAFHPTFVELSREARMYPLLGLAFVTLAEASVAALDRRRVPVRFWVAALAGPLVHPTWALAVVPLAAWVVTEARRDERGLRAPEAVQRVAQTVAWGIAASVAVLVAFLFFATPQHQELVRRPWSREWTVFAARPFVGSDLRRTLGPALVVTAIGWIVCSIRGFAEGDSRARRFALWVGVGIPVASVVSGTVGGVPWGPARYVHLLGIGSAALASLAALHSTRVQQRLAEPLTRATWAGRRLLGTPLRRSFREDPVGLPWLVGALVLLCVLRMREPRTAWSDAARELRDGVEATVPIVVEDEGTRLVLQHYLGRPVTLLGAGPGAGGAPPPGAIHVRLDTSLPTPMVRLDATR